MSFHATEKEKQAFSHQKALLSFKSLFRLLLAAHLTWYSLLISWSTVVHGKAFKMLAWRSQQFQFLQWYILFNVHNLSPSYNGSALTRYQPMCQEHQVSTSACSPDPRLPLHPSFPTKLPGEHLLWTHSNESGQAVESPCLAKLLQSDDSDV